MIPAVIEVLPEVEFAPEMVSVPVPFLVMPPVVPLTEEKVVLEFVLSVRMAVPSDSSPKVRAPVPPEA